VALGGTTHSSFAYEAQTVDGRTFKGTIEAASATDAQEKLAHLHLRVLSVEPAPAARTARKKALGTDDFLLFNQQLAYLTAAGLPVERGLRLIATDLRTGRLSKAAAAVATDLEGGMPLQQAFDRHASRFPPLYARLIEAGVSSSSLPGMLFNLGRHLELVGRLKQALWRVMSYPLMVLGAMAIVFYFISTVVLPHFEVLYGQFRDFPSVVTLPLFTRVFLKLGHFYPIIFFVLLGAAALVLLCLLILRLRGRDAVVVEAVLLRVPFIGPVVRTSLLARWIDALRLGIDAGLDLPRAIRLASDATASARLSREGARLAEILSSGGKPSDFRGRIIPQTVPAAIELGSATGDLQTTLATLSSMYEQQTEHRLQLLPTIITPLLMIFVAIAITIGIGALFLPMVAYLRALTEAIY
jgi:type IV pilus assembly protein PilC